MVGTVYTLLGNLQPCTASINIFIQGEKIIFCLKIYGKENTDEVSGAYGTSFVLTSELSVM